MRISQLRESLPAKHVVRPKGTNHCIQPREKPLLVIYSAVVLIPREQLLPELSPILYHRKKAVMLYEIRLATIVKGTHD